MRKNILTVLASGALLSLAHGDALSTAAAGLARGQWVEFPGTGWNRDLIYIDMNGADGSTANTDWSDYLCWNPATRELFYLGAGHLRAHKFIRYKGATNTWAGDNNLPSCFSQGGYGGCFTHGYDNGTLDPAAGIFYYFAGSLWAYNIGANSWSSSTPPSGFMGGYGTAYEYFPPDNAMFRAQGGAVTYYTLPSGATQPLASGLSMGPYHNKAVYSTRHKMVFFGGGNGSSDFYSMDSAKNIVKHPNAPGQIHVAYTTLTTDPLTGDVIFLAEGGGLYTFDPVVNAWKSLGTAPFTDHALASPIDADGVIYFGVPQSIYKTYLYRYAKAIDTLPVQSVSLTALPPSIEQYLTASLTVVTTFSGNQRDTSASGCPHCEFTSLDTGVATVTQSGTVTATGVGATQIRVTRGGAADTVNFNVTASTATLDSLSITVPSFKMMAGESFWLGVTGFYHKSAQTFQRDLTTSANWSSSNGAIASVSQGHVTGLAMGGPVAIVAEESGVRDTSLFTILPHPAFIARINFQVTSTPWSYGWMADNGGAYSGAKGIGWVNPTGLDSRDDRSGNNFLLKSFVSTTSRSVYRVALPDGDYIVKGATGDNTYGGSDTVFFGGNAISTHTGTSNGFFKDTLTVTGGTGLQLTVNGKIDYLVVISSEGIDIDLVADDGGTPLPVVRESAVRFDATPMISIFPNPSRSTVAIHISGVPGHRSALYDVRGRLIQRFTTGKFILRDLPAGVYTVRINIGSKVNARRLVIIK